MTGFAFIAAVMLAMVLAFLLVPLLKASRRNPGADRPAQNLAIYRDQLAELERDLQNRVLGREQYEAGRAELKRRMLEDLAEEPASGGASHESRPAGRRGLAVVLSLFVPLAAVLLYIRIGSPEAVQIADYLGDGQIDRADIERAVRSLATRVEKNPGDMRAWAVLGQFYFSLGRYRDAVGAYERAVQLDSGDPELLVGLALSLHQANGAAAASRADELAAKALAIAPDHPGALALAGGSAFAAGDYQTAIRRWERLLALLPPESPAVSMIKARVAEARTSATTANAAARDKEKRAVARAPRAVLSGTVRLGPALADAVAPQDTLFVYARAVDGSRMPLAVLKRAARDLPLDFTLDDTMAMAGGKSLSGHSEVVLVVRVSKSGGAAPQAGDLQGSTGPVKVGSTGVVVVIDQRVPER